MPTCCAHYKQSEYGKVILPFTVLRRLDCVLEPAKAAVLIEKTKREKAGLNPDQFLFKQTQASFYNTDAMDMKKLVGDQHNIAENLRAYIAAFSPAVRGIFENFEFHSQIDKLAKAGLLYRVTEKFNTIDLHPNAVSNADMGAVPVACSAWQASTWQPEPRGTLDPVRRCCFCCTWLRRCGWRLMAAAALVLCSMARRCLQAVRCGQRALPKLATADCKAHRAGQSVSGNQWPHQPHGA